MLILNSKYIAGQNWQIILQNYVHMSQQCRISMKYTLDLDF